MTTTVVHLLRHGEVENPKKILYGRLPGYHLSAAGREMAEKAAVALSERDLTYLVSSPLDRALDTAAPLAARTGLEVALDERFIEPTNFFEGKEFGVGDGALRHPGNWKALWNPFRPSWGEPYKAVALRMIAGMAAARELARGHEAVVVSHQLPIWVTRLQLSGKRLWHDPRKRECSLASVTSFTYDGEELVDIGYTEPAGKTDPNAARGA
ncbi:MAG TPA: histidine phosphatase family protein [Mycobacteriales bacterium]|nr:histidine phosphatase family protein [Mycobacteriales bacterium]